MSYLEKLMIYTYLIFSEIQIYIADTVQPVYFQLPN